GGVFVGIEAGLLSSSATVSTKIENNTYDAKIGTENSRSFGVKVGSYSPEKDARFYLFYHNTSRIYGAKLYTFALGGAYTPRIYEELRWNLGAYVGLSKLDSVELKNNAFILGPAFGLNAGIIYELNTLGELELGIRYEGASYDIKTVDVVGAEHLFFVLDKISLEFSHIGVLIGYNYKF
ncbi:MAG: hypothetical protein ACTTH5_05815, partial [Wolinella sp.]